MKTATIKAITKKIPSSLGGFYEVGDTIKTINLENVERVTCMDRHGDITFYYRNGLHEIYNGNNIEVIFE